MDDGQVTGQDETLPGRDADERTPEGSPVSWLTNMNAAHHAFHRGLPPHSDWWEELNELWPSWWDGRERDNYCPHECDTLCKPRLDRDGRLHPSGGVLHYYLPFEEESGFAEEFRPGPHDELYGGILLLLLAAAFVVLCVVLVIR